MGTAKKEKKEINAKLSTAQEGAQRTAKGAKVMDDRYLFKGFAFLIENESEAYTNRVAASSCLQFPVLRDYLGTKDGYVYHISDLKVYDKPRTLRRTDNPGDTFCNLYPIKRHGYEKCQSKGHCLHGQKGGTEKCNGPVCLRNFLGLPRPPQSWCYVEYLEKQ